MGPFKCADSLNMASNQLNNKYSEPIHNELCLGPSFAKGIDVVAKIAL